MVEVVLFFVVVVVVVLLSVFYDVDDVGVWYLVEVGNGLVGFEFGGGMYGFCFGWCSIDYVLSNGGNRVLLVYGGLKLLFFFWLRMCRNLVINGLIKM